MAPDELQMSSDESEMTPPGVPHEPRGEPQDGWREGLRGEALYHISPGRGLPRANSLPIALQGAAMLFFGKP